MDKINSSPDLVPNSEAKGMVKPKVVKTNLSQHQKQKAAERHQGDPAREMTSNLAQVLKAKKLAECNNRVKYLLVAVIVLSRFLRVVPKRSKSAPDAAKVFEKMIERVQPQKVSSDKGSEIKGAFTKLSNRKEIATYTTVSETRSAFGERKIRSLRNIMYKENKWTYHYISKLSQFFSTTHA